jgi:hypothetical protein
MSYKILLSDYTGNSGKKFTVIVFKNDKKIRTVHFGQDGASDYTIHKDHERMKRYLSRHKDRGENWGKSGIATAGFWSRWLLWSKPSLKAAITLIKNKFNVNITMT